MHSVCGRKVQGVKRIGRVHGLWDRDVLYNSRGQHNLRYMPRLSVKLQLACGERSFDELHLQ